MDRDLEIHRVTAQLRHLSRFDRDLCLGHFVVDGSDPVYVGRIGLTDDDGRQLVVDWRSAAAEPFFAATHAHRMGVVRRRRYRWSHGKVVDYWDESFGADAFTAEGFGTEGFASVLDELDASRTGRMRDVLGTLAADQDAIIRADSAGTLVVDGGPGTGKTVVALHRVAYLLYADSRLAAHRGGVLVVGPNEHFLSYVQDVLPALGEDGVAMTTIRDLVDEGTTAIAESASDVAAIKGRVDWETVIDRAVAFYEDPPRTCSTIETDWVDVRVTPDDWAAAMAAPERGTPHNEARTIVRDALVEILVDKQSGDVPRDAVATDLAQSVELRRTLYHSWPMLDATDIVGDLWTVPAYLRRCAPELTDAEIAVVQRHDPHAWTVADLPILDAARLRLGDAGADDRTRRLQAEARAQRAHRESVIDDLVAADDGEGLITMLRGGHLHDVLVDTSAITTVARDRRDGPFAHIVVDEAQELTDAEWQMLLRRCPTKSFTIVGDRAQSRHLFTESWDARTARTGLIPSRVSPLTINYRTPAEIMDTAAPMIRRALPDAGVPTSIRRGKSPVRYAPMSALDEILKQWLTDNHEGVACVITMDPLAPTSTTVSDRVRILTPESAKGLEFDLVVLVDPATFGDGVTGAVDRYVAMTRATQELVILS